MTSVVRLRDLPAPAQRRVRAQLAVADHWVKTHPARAQTGPTPQDILWQEVARRWPEAQREYPMIPGRRFRGDIVFPAAWLCIEVDGWRYHARLLKDFKRDRARQNLLTIAGWRLLRIPAGDVRHDLKACCALIALALNSPPRSIPCLVP
jgi:very-short-patch-repair endonuclease